jgi:hypothetical protein
MVYILKNEKKMKKIMNTLMLSCRKATELIEKQSVFELNTLEKTQLFFHLKVCEACKQYEKQSTIIDTIMQDTYTLKSDKSEVEELIQPTEADKALIQKINKRLEKEAH